MSAEKTHTENGSAPQADQDAALLQLAMDAIEELKGESITVLDVSSLTTIADHMIICSGRSARHVKRIGETVIEHAKKTGMLPRVEGLGQSEWVLIDLNGVIVHVMQPVTRAYYQIEKLWDMNLATQGDPEKHGSH